VQTKEKKKITIHYMRKCELIINQTNPILISVEEFIEPLDKM